MKYSPQVTAIAEQLKTLLDPDLLLLFNVKYENGTAHDDYPGDITDLDFCAIVPFSNNEERTQLLRRAYLNTESDVPFDVFLYSPEEWKTLSADPGTFASRISRKGTVCYVKNAPQQ